MRVILALLLIFASAANVAFAHGGGCRKDSPPGKCCHMERKTGIPHCH